MKPVQKADIFRYIVLMVHGGVYADIDVTCVRPVDQWIAHTGNYFNMDFLVSDSACSPCSARSMQHAALRLVRHSGAWDGLR